MLLPPAMAKRLSVVAIGAVFTACGICSVFMSVYASLASVAWKDVTGVILATQREPGVQRKPWYQPNCHVEIATVEDYATTLSDTEVCVVDANGIQLASYSTHGATSPSYGIKLASDNHFHRLEDWFPDNVYPVLLSDGTLIGSKVSNAGNLHLFVLKDAAQHLISTKIGTGYTTYNTVYKLDLSSAILPVDENSRGTPVAYIAASQNNKFAAMQGLGRGILRVNLETYEVKLVSNDFAGHLKTKLAISNDGNTIAVTGDKDAPHRIYSDIGNCGSLKVEGVMLASDQMCPYASFSINIEGYAAVGQVYNPQFATDDVSFVVHAWSESEQLSRRLTLTPDPNSRRIDYLALGDSYASGEGAILAKRYLPWTNQPGNYSANPPVPEEKCHVSSESYPFLLKLDKGLTSMHSVACSGAITVDVFGARKDTTEFDSSGRYLGQRSSKRDAGRLRDMDDSRRKALQALALGNFIPGRIQQIDFVKKYQPKAITLSLGGNDVRFGEILRSCIISVMSPCDWARQGTANNTSASLQSLGRMIAGQYITLRDTYSAIKGASPMTKLYVIGYPQFISNGSICIGNNIGLSQAERSMAVHAVSYINKIIKVAANDAGAYYIDIEDSLGVHTLCGVGSLTDPYVNGTALGIASRAGLSVDEQEAYHPNATGHRSMFERINQGLGAQTLKTFNNCQSPIIVCPKETSVGAPLIDSYFVPPGSVIDAVLNFTNMVGAYVSQTAQQVYSSTANGVKSIAKQVQVSLNQSSGSFKELSWISITIYSNPTEIASAQAGSDGSVATVITLPPSIPAGPHTLVMKGQDSTGKEVVYVQPIIVTGSDPGDLDENGVSDSQQACGPFIVVSSRDVDNDGVDDACDPVAVPLTAQESQLGDVPAGSIFPRSIYGSQSIGDDRSVSDVGIKDMPLQKTLDSLKKVGRQSQSLHGHTSPTSISLFWVVISAILLLSVMLLWIVKCYQYQNRSSHD